MDMEKYALVTGSSDRIGKAIAQILGRLGFNLVLHYNSSKGKAEKLSREIEDLGVKTILLQADFMKTNDYYEILSSFQKENLQIELLVNNASGFVESSFSQLDSKILEQQMQINFENAYLLTKAFAKVYKAGNVINILDTKVEKLQTKHLDYLLSKKLLKEFTLISALHLAPEIRVNAIAPGIILPPSDKDENYINQLAQGIPLKRKGSLQDIQKAVQFLIECDFVTGQILYIDGGEHLSA